MKYGLNVTLFVYNMQPCATSRLTINSYRFCSWEQVPGEPSKYCSFAYREEPNRNVLSPCFSLVFKGVAGVLILSHITAPLLIHFSFDMHKANRKQHTGESGTLGETQKGGRCLQSDLWTEWVCLKALPNSRPCFGIETSTKFWLHSRKTQGTPTTIWVVHTRQRLPTSLRFIPQLTQSKWAPE